MINKTRPYAILGQTVDYIHSPAFLARDAADAVMVRNELVRSNLRLVVSIAKRYVRPAHDLFELVSEGNMSLILAVEKFDYARTDSNSAHMPPQ